MIIKEFSEFNTNTKWHVKMSSSAKKYGLSNEQIQSVLHSNTDPINVEFHNELDSSINKKYDSDSVSWQTSKKAELNTLLNNNLSIDINDIVTVTIEYDVEFPNDWDKGDISGWCEGFTKINQAYYFVHSERIAQRYTDNPDGETRDANYNEIKSFLNEMMTNQKFEAYELR